MAGSRGLELLRYGFVVTGVRGYRGGLHVLDESDETGKGLFACGFVAWHGVAGIFAGAHEAVTCTVVGDGLILFASGFHSGSGCGDGGADAGVVAGVETVDGRGDRGHIRGTRSIENEGGGEIFAVSCKGEGFAPSPAKAGDGDLTVGCGELLAVVRCCVEIGVDDGGIEAGDSFDGGVLIGKGAGTAAVGTEASEEVRSDDDEALRS